MKSILYYFSGSGNSLKAAKDLAEKTGSDLISIASVMENKKSRPDADVIGFVFPVYYVANDGMPLIIGRFIDRLEGIEDKYLYAVCTCNGSISTIITTLQNRLKPAGGVLAGGFIIPMPMSYATYSRPTPAKTKEKMFAKYREKLETIAGYINNRKTGTCETVKPWLNSLLAPLGGLVKKKIRNDFNRLIGTENLDFPELIPLLDRIFSISEACNGCGICARICPVKNIEMIGTRPAWQHHCESCFACVQWCPERAILCNGKLPSNFYHHPDIDAKDMLRR